MIVFILLASGISCVYFVVSAVRESGGSANYVAALICLLVFIKNLSALRTNRKGDMSEYILQIEDDDRLQEALSSPKAVLYKHSTRCPVSANVYRDVQSFASHHPDVPVYMLKVREYRDLSNAASERLEVPHQSPQIFLLRHGKQIWNASQYDITEKALKRQLSEKEKNG